MKYVYVRFENHTKTYAYVCLDGTVKVGDYFLVQPNVTPAIVEVISIAKSKIPAATKALGPKLNIEHVTKHYRENQDVLKAKALLVKKVKDIEAKVVADAKATLVLRHMELYEEPELFSIYKELRGL